MTATALALSPHLDDAVFSCGGTLAMLAREGWRIEVATLFTATVAEPQGFALACQTDKGIGPDIDYMALRREEDRAAMSALGAAPPRHLDFAEAPHRGYGSAAALFADVRPDDDICASLAQAIARLLAETRPGLVLAPQAIGGHVDHVQLVRAVTETGTRAPVLWWRDFPYVARDTAPKEPFATAMEARPSIGAAVDANAAAAKRNACLAYASQLGFQFGGPAGLECRLRETAGLERFRLDGALAATTRALFEGTSA